MATLDARLSLLEQRRGKVRSFFLLQPDETLTAEQQAQVDEANAQQHPVLIVRLHHAEDAQQKT
jgi:hypothetical protein